MTRTPNHTAQLIALRVKQLHLLYFSAGENRHQCMCAFMMHDAQKCRAVGDKPRGLPAYRLPNHTKNRRANQVNQTANRRNHK